MSTGVWYYLVENDQRQGPFSLEALKDVLTSRGLDRNTLIWSPGLVRWLPAHQVQELADILERLPPPAPRAEAVQDPFSDPHVPQVRPWVRFAAKTIDLAWVGALVELAVGAMGAGFLGSGNPTALLALLGVVSGVLLILVEGVLLSTWGTTPGKALLRMRLRRQDGTLASFEAALKRSFRAFSTGLACNLPFLCWLGMMYSYGYYTGKGAAPWDEGWRVQFGKIGAVRGAIAAFLVVAVYLLSWYAIANF